MYFKQQYENPNTHTRVHACARWNTLKEKSQYSYLQFGI